LITEHRDHGYVAYLPGTNTGAKGTSMKSIVKIAAASLLLISTGTLSANAACDGDASTETVLGAGSGALVGGLASHSIAGAAIGGVAGGLIGNSIGHSNNREDCRRDAYDRDAYYRDQEYNGAAYSNDRSDPRDRADAYVDRPTDQPVYADPSYDGRYQPRTYQSSDGNRYDYPDQ
jgi:hypothetical protein